jgi:hypothetical protein
MKNEKIDMKENILKIIKEEVGVPKGILELSESIYNELLNDIKKINYSPEQTEYKFSFKKGYSISDYDISKIILELRLFTTEKVNEPTLAGMAFQGNIDFDYNKLVFQHIKNSQVNLSADVAIPNDDDFNNVINYIKENKSLFVSSLSHELMHAYDDYKTNITKPEKRASYQAYKDINFGIEPINKFLFYLYFIHSIENVVRPTEIASDLKTGNIDKVSFFNFLKNNRVYQLLQDINKFDYNNFKNELLDYSDRIREVLTEINYDNIPNNDRELVEVVLNLLYLNIVDKKIEIFQMIIAESFFETFLGFNKRKGDVFDKYIKRVKKYNDNYNEFFMSEEENMRNISTKVIRKIHKLYSLLPDKTTNESIINWELYHKIKKTPIVIETKFKKY